MDRCHMEPGDGLYEGQPGLQTLLCGASGTSASVDETSELSARFRADAATANVGVASALEIAEAHLRELDERPLSQGCPELIHQTRLRCYEPRALAPVSGSDQAFRARIGIKQETPVGSPYLDGREHRNGEI